MTSFIEYSDITKNVFTRVPPDQLIANRTVSKAWSREVSKDYACSIIETSLRVTKDLFHGKISAPQQIFSQMYAGTTCTSSNGPSVGIVEYLIKNTLDGQTTTIPFSAFEHISLSKKLDLASKFLNSGVTAIKGEKEEMEKARDELFNLLYETLDGSKLTIFSAEYEIDESNPSSCPKIKEISFKPVKEEGKIYVDDRTIDRVKGFFKDHKVMIPLEAPKTLPEQYQPEKVLEKVQNQFNSFLGKYL